MARRPSSTREAARRAATETQARLASIVSASEDAIVVKKLDGTITDWNAGAEVVYGYTAAEMIGQPVSRLIPGECAAEATEILTRISEGQRLEHFETVRLHRDGHRLDLSMSVTPIRAANGAIVGAASIGRDISARKRADAVLAYQALHDELTGLPNRTLLCTRLDEALTAERGDRPSAALLLLDLDRVREVNDTLRHQAGDALLQQISQRLQNAVLPSELVARIGAVEFAVLLPGSDGARATQTAEALARVVQQAPFMFDGQPIAVDASIGIAVAPEHGQSADGLLRCADVAVFQAKRCAPSVALYSASGDKDSPDGLTLLAELRSAIDRDDLLLHYQPKLNMRDGTLVGVEALVRWQHPRRGFMPPSEFLPLAEQTGLIHPLSRWVLDAALKQQRAWRARGIDVPVAVNLSRRTLHDPKLPELVAQLLTRWDAPPGSLILEITESGLMADPLPAAEKLRQLRALGVRMSIDDFGTGYSSLAELKNLSVDELKIDRTFVHAMATDASSRAIVRAIIDLADALKLRVVAEGVEDRATWDVLAGLGCEVAQGYFVSRPIAAAELEAWVAQAGLSWLAMAERSNVEDALQERLSARRARLTAEEEFIALRASEERSRVAMQTAGMGIWDSDVIRGVQTWSVQMEALHGMPPGTFGGTFEAFKNAIHPDDWPSFQLEMVTSGDERRDAVTSYRTVWPDGSTHWIENKARATCAPDGTLVRVNGTSVDITERKQAEAALRTSEECNRLALEAARMGTWQWDAIGDVHTWSAETVALFGLATGTFEGDSAAFKKLIHPDDWDAFEHEMQVSGDERRDSIATYRIVWADGSEHWVEDKGRAIFAADGTLLRINGTTMDITERKAAEARDRLLTTALEASASAVVVTSRDGLIEWANKAFTELTGYSLPEVLGKSATLLESGAHDADFLRDLRATVLAGTAWQGELINRRKDGSLYTEEITLTPVRDDTGEIAHLVAIRQDVTARKQAQLELQAERDFAQQVMTTMGQGLAVTDRDVRFVYVNPALATMMGCAPEDLIGRSALDFRAAAEGPPLFDIGHVEFATGPSNYEIEVRRSDGRSFNAVLSLAPRHRGEEYTGAIAVLTDLTERKQLEAALSEARDEALAASRAKSDFLATMSHEIRTPMNGVMGMTALLLDSDLTRAQRDYAEAVERSGDALLELINEILDFSKIEAGKLALEILDLDIRALLEDMVELLAPQAETKGLELACIVDHRVSRALLGDPGRLRQILTNLVGNALKFTSHGQVLVQVKLVDRDSEATLVRFEVSDSGIGISPDAQTRLFEPFTQADSSVTRKFGGTGLGLAICRRLVELMGGEIGIDSQPHQGSTFWFTLRLANGAQPGHIDDEAMHGPARSLDKQRIMLVCDHPTNRDILREHFASWRITADEVVDGAAALPALREAAGSGKPYDLVLVGAHGSGSDGLDLALAIKSDLPIAGTHIVLLAPRAEIPPKDHAERAGFAACVALPVRQSQLFDTLAEVLFADRTLGEAAPPARPAAKVPLADRGVGRLLVVEDSRINQRVALGLLQRLGFRADAVANGVEALEALGRGTYEAVFMDCQMPEMDGYEATREWRRREMDGSGRHMRIIAMTANAMQGDRDACLQAGMDDYISKPVRRQELSDCLDRWLASKAAA